MIQENLEDAAQIIVNILTQPLSITGIEEEESLVQACMRYNGQEHDSSDLRKMIESFHQYPESTETMLRELEILEEELATPKLP